GLAKQPLARFALLLACPEDAARDLPAVVRWSDVASQRLIGLPSAYPIQRLVDEQLARAGRTAPPELVCNFLETQIAMVEAGAGAAVTPASALPACAKRRVSMHAIGDPGGGSDPFWVGHRAHKLPPPAGGFAAFLKGYLGRIAEQAELLAYGSPEGRDRLVHDRAAGALQHQG